MTQEGQDPTEPPAEELSPGLEKKGNVYIRTDVDTLFPERLHPNKKVGSSTDTDTAPSEPRIFGGKPAPIIPETPIQGGGVSKGLSRR